jgi:uncharacterized membrane protein
VAVTHKKPAWGTPATAEPRWPASVALVIAGVLYLLLPGGYQTGPYWLIPAIELVVLVPLSIAAPMRRHGEPRWQQIAAFTLIAVLNTANLISLVRLIVRLVHGGKVTDGSTLLFTAASIWLTNVIVFALWYWELDRGGPDERLLPDHRRPDFLFPQMSTPGCTYAGWTPKFIDYLYVASTNATAFSPTDTLPLTPLAKSLMLIQSVASLLTVTLVAARAVNILQ